MMAKMAKGHSPIPLANFGTTPLDRGLVRRPTKRPLDAEVLDLRAPFATRQGQSVFIGARRYML